MKQEFIQMHLLTVCVWGSRCHRRMLLLRCVTFFKALPKIITWRVMLSANCIEISILIHKMDTIRNLFFEAQLLEGISHMLDAILSITCKAQILKRWLWTEA